MRKRGLCAMACAATLFASGVIGQRYAFADDVVVHDHGRKVSLEGADAAEVERLVLDLFERSHDGGGIPGTAEWVYLRANEVAVEVRLDKPRFGASETPREIFLIPLTGYFTGTGGNDANIYIGRVAPLKDRLTVGALSTNAPDDAGFQYYSIYSKPEALEPLRQAVAKAGIQAPRQGQPRYTPEPVPKEMQPPAADE